MIVPSPAGMRAAAFNIGRLAVYSRFPLPWCVLFIHPLAYGIQIQTYTGGLESGVERGTVSECLTLRVV